MGVWRKNSMQENNAFFQDCLFFLANRAVRFSVIDIGSIVEQILFFSSFSFSPFRFTFAYAYILPPIYWSLLYSELFPRLIFALRLMVFVIFWRSTAKHLSLWFWSQLIRVSVSQREKKKSCVALKQKSVVYIGRRQMEIWLRVKSCTQIFKVHSKMESGFE